MLHHYASLSCNILIEDCYSFYVVKLDFVNSPKTTPIAQVREALVKTTFWYFLRLLQKRNKRKEKKEQYAHIQTVGHVYFGGVYLVQVIFVFFSIIHVQDKHTKKLRKLVKISFCFTCEMMMQTKEWCFFYIYRLDAYIITVF